MQQLKSNNGFRHTNDIWSAMAYTKVLWQTFGADVGKSYCFVHISNSSHAFVYECHDIRLTFRGLVVPVSFEGEKAL